MTIRTSFCLTQVLITVHLTAVLVSFSYALTFGVSFCLTWVLVLIAFHLPAVLVNCSYDVTSGTSLDLTWVFLVFHLTAALLYVPMTPPLATSFHLIFCKRNHYLSHYRLVLFAYILYSSYFLCFECVCLSAILITSIFSEFRRMYLSSCSHSS